jgi:hypothetical protein
VENLGSPDRAIEEVTGFAKDVQTKVPGSWLEAVIYYTYGSRSFFL